MWACRDIAAELSDECLNQEIFYSLKEAVPIAATTEAPVWSKYWSEASISSIANLIALITVPVPHRRPG